MANANDDFKFEQFAIAAIREIDSLRSTQNIKRGNESIETGSSSKPTESRINTLYRAIGLPATMPAKEENEKAPANSSRPHKRNNGNTNEKLTFSNYETKLDSRQKAYTFPVTELEITTFLIGAQGDVIRGSILAENDPGYRKRGLLFPMVVDGRIDVQSHSKRIAGAFMEDWERKDNKDYYRKPLLETIINMKLTGSNVGDSSEQTSVSSDLDSTDSNLELDAKSLEKLEKTLNSLPATFVAAQTKVNRVRKQTGIEVIATIDNVAEQNPKTRINPDRPGKLDIISAAQKDAQRIDDALLILVKYKNRKKDGKNVATKSVEDAALASSFFEILTPNKETKAKEKEAKVDEQLERNKKDAKDAHKTLDLMLGTFAGISGTDIIVVFSALYTLDLDHLIGLLNDEARERLKALKGDDVVSGAKEVSVSITELEKNVRDKFETLSLSFNSQQHEKNVEYQTETADPNSNEVQ